MNDAPNITINGRDFEMVKDWVTYDEIVQMAGMTGNPSMTFAMKFGAGPDGQPARYCGILHSTSQPLSLWGPTHFDCVHTGNA